MTDRQLWRQSLESELRELATQNNKLAIPRALMPERAILIPSRTLQLEGILSGELSAQNDKHLLGDFCFLLEMYDIKYSF